MEMKIRAWRWMVSAVLWGAMGGAMGGAMAGASGKPAPAVPGVPSGWESGVAGSGALEGASARDARHERDTLRIVEEETLLAVVIRTTGLAARFAPDHLIHASEYDLLLVLDPEAPEEARFTASLPVARLVVDDHTVKREVEDRLLELAILEDPYDEMSEDDRERTTSPGPSPGPSRSGVSGWRRPCGPAWSGTGTGSGSRPSELSALAIWGSSPTAPSWVPFETGTSSISTWTWWPGRGEPPGRGWPRLHPEPRRNGSGHLLQCAAAFDQAPSSASTPASEST